MTTPNAPDSKPRPETINFDYLKGAEFRVLHADGAFAALTTQGGLAISFFSERQPIPRRVVHKLNPDGSIGDEIAEQRVVRDAMVRDVDVTITMNMEAAKRISELFAKIIQKFDEIARADGGKK